MLRMVLAAVALTTVTGVVAAPILPAKAKSLKGAFVMAYGTCFGPDRSTNPPLSFAACAVTRSNPSCGFDLKGSGKYAISIGKDAAGGPDLKFKVAFSGLDAGCEGGTLTLSADFRITTDDCTTPDCTTVAQDDFPIAGSCTVTGGKCKFKTTLETWVGVGDDVLKVGATYNIEFGEIAANVNGIRAFTEGLAIRP